MKEEAKVATPGPNQGKRDDGRADISAELHPVNLVQDKVFSVHRRYALTTNRKTLELCVSTPHARPSECDMGPDMLASFLVRVQT
jgi:hypothetical protein